MFKNAKVTPGVANPIEYHAPQQVKRGDHKFVMTSTELRSFATCPDRWFNDYKFDGSKATKFGNLFDTRLLTPELFDKRYVVCPPTYPANSKSAQVASGECGVGDEIPWDGKASYCKKWKADQDPSLEVVSTAEVEDVDFAIRRMNSKPTIKAFLESCDKQVLVTAEWHDPKTGLIVPVKCLIDMVPRLDTEFAKCLGDLKSTRSAALLPFKRDAFTMGYHIQAAFYHDMYVAASNEDRCDYIFLICENIHPFQPGKRLMDDDFISLGHAAYQRILSNYCQCLKSGRWPDYDETDEAVGDWSLLSPEPFMAEREAFAPKFMFGDEAETVPMDQTRDDGEIIP